MIPVNVSALADKHDSRRANNEMSLLLRLPGEIRNEIYSYLTVNCSVRILPHSSVRGRPRVPDVVFSYSPRHRALTQISSEIRKEVCSYILDHGTFYVWIEDLPVFCSYLEDEKKNRICTLVIDVIYQKPSTERNDASQIVEHLSPLCEGGRLSRIVVMGSYGYIYPCYIQPDVLVEQIKLSLPFDVVERGVHISFEKVEEVEEN